MSEQPRRQLKKLAKKHNLRQARLRIDGEPKTWLERNQVPEGFELELPPPFQVFTSTVDGKRLTVSSPLALIGRHPPDELHERQQRAEERIAWQFGDNVVQVREWKTSVEIEMERLQATLDEYCQGACAAMNAWMFLVLESLPEANASGKSSREKYEGDMMRLRSQYRQDRGSSIEERLIDTGKYPGKTYVLNSLSEKYSARQMLRFESIIFWGHLVKPLTAEELRGEFSKLCTFFDIEPLIEETTLDGLLYYRQKIDDQVEELLPLECRRSACEVRHTVIVRKEVVVRRRAPIAIRTETLRQHCETVVAAFDKHHRLISSITDLMSYAGETPVKKAQDVLRHHEVLYEHGNPEDLVQKLEQVLEADASR